MTINVLTFLIFSRWSSSARSRHFIFCWRALLAISIWSFPKFTIAFCWSRSVWKRAVVWCAWIKSFRTLLNWWMSWWYALLLLKTVTFIWPIWWRKLWCSRYKVFQISVWSCFSMTGMFDSNVVTSIWVSSALYLIKDCWAVIARALWIKKWMQIWWMCWVWSRDFQAYIAERGDSYSICNFFRHSMLDTSSLSSVLYVTQKSNACRTLRLKTHFQTIYWCETALEIC